jgi:hypothetical protein
VSGVSEVLHVKETLELPVCIVRSSGHKSRMTVFESIRGSYSEPCFKGVKDGYEIEFGKKGSEKFTIYLRRPKKMSC